MSSVDPPITQITQIHHRGASTGDEVACREAAGSDHEEHLLHTLFVIAPGCLAVCGRLRRPPIEAHSLNECLSGIARFARSPFDYAQGTVERRALTR